MTSTRWMNSGTVLLIATVTCFPAAAMAATHVELKATPESNPTALEVIDNDSQCVDGKLACIAVPRGSSHNLFFDLDATCRPDGSGYRLSAFRLANADKDWPTAEKPLRAEITEDFNADPNTGYIKWDDNNTLSNHRIKLKDNNISAYSVYYEVTATACTGSGEIKLDPVIKNGGGGNP